MKNSKIAGLASLLAGVAGVAWCAPGLFGKVEHDLLWLVQVVISGVLALLGLGTGGVLLSRDPKEKRTTEPAVVKVTTEDKFEPLPMTTIAAELASLQLQLALHGDGQLLEQAIAAGYAVLRRIVEQRNGGKSNAAA